MITEKTICGVIFDREDDGSITCKFGREDQDTAMNCFYTIFCKAIELHEKNDIELFEAVVSAIEGIKSKYPGIARDIERNTFSI